MKRIERSKKLRKGSVSGTVIVNIIRVLAAFQAVLYFVPVMSFKTSFYEGGGFLDGLFGWGGQQRQSQFSVSLMDMTFGRQYANGYSNMQPRYFCLVFIIVPVAILMFSFFVQSEGALGFIVLVCVIESSLALFTDKLRLEDAGMTLHYNNWFYAIIATNALLAIFALIAFINSNMR